MSDTAFEWSVAKLQELDFDGDADALAAYVNALIENNRDEEAGDPRLLRARARQELEEFLGPADAETFVNGLMRQLTTDKPQYPTAQVQSQSQSASTARYNQPQPQPQRSSSPPSRDTPHVLNIPTERSPIIIPQTIIPQPQQPAQQQTHSQNHASHQPPHHRDDPAPRHHQPSRSMSNEGSRRSPQQSVQHHQQNRRQAPQREDLQQSKRYQSQTQPQQNSHDSRPASRDALINPPRSMAPLSMPRNSAPPAGPFNQTSRENNLAPRTPAGHGSDNQMNVNVGQHMTARSENRAWNKQADPSANNAKPDFGAQDDLRNLISRPKAAIPAKRPRDGETKEEGDKTEIRNPNAVDGQAPATLVHRLGDGGGIHEQSIVTAEPTNKYPRRTFGTGSAGPEARIFGRNNGAPAVGISRSNGPQKGIQSLGTMPYPPPPPGFLQHMHDMMHPATSPHPGFPGPVPGMLPPPGVIMPPGLPPPFIPAGRGSGNVVAGRIRGRGAGVVGAGLAAHPGGAIQNRGRALANVLIMRNVPPEKLTLGAINEYFQKFGTVSNIQLRPAQNPDHAFIEFALRSQAQAAYACVDAVMGNRHVRLYWARESDFEQDGIPLQGVVFAPPMASKKPQTNSGDEKMPPAAAKVAPVVEESPEAVLQRKRKEIAAAREEQMKAKAERQAEYDRCIAEQKALFAKLEAGCSDEDKREILKRIKAVGKEAEAILCTVKPKDPELVKSVPPTMVGRPGGRARGPMSADFRPKVVRIVGSTPSEDLTEVSAVTIFHDTLTAKRTDDDIWILDFASRRAAESAMKAVGVLKKRFGPKAVMTLADSRPPEDTKPPVSDDTASADVEAAVSSKRVMDGNPAETEIPAV